MARGKQRENLYLTNTTRLLAQAEVFALVITATSWGEQEITSYSTGAVGAQADDGTEGRGEC